MDRGCAKNRLWEIRWKCMFFIVLCTVTGFDFPLAPIRFVGPNWGLLISLGCVQRWGASSQVWGWGSWKSYMYEQDNAWPWPQSVSCLAKNGNSNAGDEYRTERASWNTSTLLFASLVCTLVMHCAIIPALYYDESLSAVKWLWGCHEIWLSETRADTLGLSAKFL